MTLEPLGIKEAVGDNKAAAVPEQPGGLQITLVTAELPLSTDGARADAGALAERAATESETSSCLEGRGGIIDCSDG